MRIYQRKDQWYLDYRDPDGKRHRHPIGGPGMTKAEAESARVDAIRAYDEELYGRPEDRNRNPAGLDIAKLVTWYVDERMSAKSRKRMSGFIQSHIINSHIGSRYIDEVETRDLEAMGAAMSRKGLSDSSVKTALAFVRAAYSYARKDKLWLSAETP